MEPIEIDNKYCNGCEKRVGKKESGEWVYYTENMITMSTYNVVTHEFETLSFYTCLDCYSHNITWECNNCNELIDSTNEFCDDEPGTRICSDCIITKIYNNNLDCNCSVCREMFELYTISPK